MDCSVGVMSLAVWNSSSGRGASIAYDILGLEVVHTDGGFDRHFKKRLGKRFLRSLRGSAQRQNGRPISAGFLFCFRPRSSISRPFAGLPARMLSAEFAFAVTPSAGDDAGEALVDAGGVNGNGGPGCAR